MVCEDCKGERGRWVKRRVGSGHRSALAQIEAWEPCGGCNGSGIAHCCEGMIGSSDEVTNGEAASG
jgi:hypothetical protein